MLARDLLKYVLDRLEIEFAEMSPEEQQAQIEDYVNKTKDCSESLDIMTIEDVFAALKKIRAELDSCSEEEIEYIVKSLADEMMRQ